jgi:hypothetical protein
MSDAVLEVVSLRECSRRLGVTLGALQKAIDTHRVTCVQWSGDRRVGVEWPTAREQWARNTDPSEAAKNGKVWVPSGAPAVTQPEREGPASAPSRVAGAADSGPHNREDLAGVGDFAGQAPDLLAAAEKRDAPAEPAAKTEGSAYHEHRARREEYDAELKRLELEKQRGRLVATEDVERAAFDEGRLLRDHLLRIPDRLATTLAAEADPVRVHALLARELRSACDAIADGATGVLDLAADGLGERARNAA